MRKLSKTIEINAPVERVYEFITLPTNLPTIWPSMVGVTNLERKADGSYAFDWTYKMAGLHFHGRSNPIEVKPNRLVVMRNDEGIKSTFYWRYEANGVGTRLTLDVEYEMPTPVLGKIAEVVVAKMNEHELDHLMTNAKTAIEAMPTVQTSEAKRAH
jgi:uncharacterized protein YndB with AHSA1/START domain